MGADLFKLVSVLGGGSSLVGGRVVDPKNQCFFIIILLFYCFFNLKLIKKNKYIKEKNEKNEK